MNKNIEIEIQLISSNGKVPSQKHASDIGYDISASDDVTLISNEVTLPASVYSLLIINELYIDINEKKMIESGRLSIILKYWKLGFDYVVLLVTILL